jgi:hypothetical protein
MLNFFNYKLLPDICTIVQSAPLMHLIPFSLHISKLHGALSIVFTRYVPNTLFHLYMLVLSSIINLFGRRIPYFISLNNK